MLTAGNGWLLSLILGEGFSRPDLLALLVLGSAFGSLGVQASWVRQFLFKVKSINARAWFGALAGLLVGALLTSAFGVIGTALAYVIAYFIYFVAQSVGTNLLPWLKYSAAIMATILCFVVVTDFSGTEQLATWIAAGVTVSMLSLLSFRWYRHKKSNKQHRTMGELNPNQENSMYKQR